MTASITVVSGSEELLVQRATHAVITHARTLPGEVVVREQPASELSTSAWEEVVAPSLFPTTTVLVVTSLADAAEGLAEQLTTFAQHPHPDVLVVLHQRATTGKKIVDTLLKLPSVVQVACAPVKTRRDKLRFVAAEFRSGHRRATEQASEFLLDAVGGDLQSLVSAVDQLISDTTGLIELTTVQQYYTGRAQVSGFAVADQTLEGRPGPALEQLRWALSSGTDPVLICSALTSGLRMVVAVASAPASTSPAALAASAGIPTWKVDQVRRQVRGWTGPTIAAAFATVAHTDAAIKGAGTDPAYALEQAVLRLCTLRG